MEPGPGQYNVQKSFEGKGIKMLGKFESFRPSYLDSPGPGQYSTETKNKVKLGKIGEMRKWKREEKDGVPGPGSYQVEGNSLVSANGPKYTYFCVFFYLYGIVFLIN
jgi:hypothetical protein